MIKIFENYLLFHFTALTQIWVKQRFLLNYQCVSQKSFISSNLSSWQHVKWASQAVLVVKNPPANPGDVRDMGLIPERGRRRPWQPYPIFLLGESHGQRSLGSIAYSPQGCKELDTTEATQHTACEIKQEPQITHLAHFFPLIFFSKLLFFDLFFLTFLNHIFFPLSIFL